MDFYVLPGLNTFDGIIGDDTLKKLEAIIDRKDNILTISPGIKIPLKEKTSTQVNNIGSKEDHLKNVYKIFDRGKKPNIFRKDSTY